MRTITPIPYTKGLLKKNEKPPTSEEEATKRWGNYQTKPKKNLRIKIISEQSGLCAYSEVNLNDHGYESHIDHVKPKSKYPHLTFEYSNIVISALTTNQIKSLGYKRHDIFGGESKLREYDPALFISCTCSDCSDYFVYLNNGEIIPNPKLSTIRTRKAEYTIKTLNLNSPILIGKREVFLENLKSLIIMNKGDKNKLNKLKDLHTKIIPSIEAKSFPSASNQTFSNLKV
ncbi:MAG: retron system putative HNH endonuclease [Colwellia sp.]